MPKNSDARIRANNKYSNAHYRALTVKIKPEHYQTIDNYCKDNNISKASLIIKAVTKYIEDNQQ